LKLLLLGSSGFLGSFAKSFIPQVSESAVLNPSRADLLAIGEGDVVSGISKIMKENNPDVVINLIAETSITKCELNTAASRESNVQIPEMLAGVLPESKLLVHMSTDAIFGRGRAPYRVLDIPSPATLYGQQKHEAEELIASLRSNYLIVRASFFGLSDSGRLGTLQYFRDRLAQGEVVNGFIDYVNNPVSMKALLRGMIRGLDIGFTGTVHLGAQESMSKFAFGISVAQTLKLDESLVMKSFAPEGFHAFGGLDLTLESESSWKSLGMAQPTTRDGILESLGE
jgi:dTDP-4-dehydrorhamnose reductase